jgi:hypothetical protein
LVDVQLPCQLHEVATCFKAVHESRRRCLCAMTVVWGAEQRLPLGGRVELQLSQAVVQLCELELIARAAASIVRS